MEGHEVCKVCNKKVLRHSYSLRCFSCKSLVHQKCMPRVDREELLYISQNNSDWYCSMCISDILPFIQVEDDAEFVSTISGNNENKAKITLDVLKDQQKLFTPFELNDDHESPLTDIDPDIQFYNNHCNSVLNSCDYYIEDSLNAKLKSLNIKENCFSLVHANIRSAPHNLSKFENYLSNINHCFSIIGMSESRVKEYNIDSQNINGYKSEHVFRPNRDGGGVSLFIKDNLDYFVRQDLHLNNRNIESLFIEVSKCSIDKSQDAIVGVLYRPPDTNIRTFSEYLDSILLKVKAESKLLYLLGDYNINLLNSSQHNATQEFTDLMFSHSLLPNITKPTRVTLKSATLIDNIFSNNLLSTNKILTGIWYSDISDHYPIFQIDYSSTTTNEIPVIKHRVFSQANMEMFSSALTNHSWDHILSDSDAQSAYSLFLNDYTKMYNDCFPLKTIKVGYKTKKGWLSEELKNAIKIKIDNTEKVKSLEILITKLSTNVFEIN